MANIQKEFKIKIKINFFLYILQKFVNFMKFDLKFDIKSILILVLLGFSLVFFYKWYFSGIDGYKKEVKRLHAENEILQHKRDSVNLIIKGLEVDFKRLQKLDSTLRVKIQKDEIEIKSAKDKANQSKTELDRLRLDLEKTKKQIEDLKNNPSNRTGDDLLNSLKIKTQK